MSSSAPTSESQVNNRFIILISCVATIGSGFNVASCKCLMS